MLSTRTRSVGVAAVVALVVTTSVARALPPDADLGSWNETLGKLDGTQAGRRAYFRQKAARVEWNCYNYAVNKKTTDPGGDPVRAHPGKGKEWPNIGRPITAADMCAKARNRAKDDGLKELPWNPGDPIPTPPAGENLVALGATAGDKGDGGDYHWWRKNADGWSHKRGSSEAETTYTDGAGVKRRLTDPRQAAQRDGYSLCGFMSVPKATPPDIGPLAALPACRGAEGQVYATALVSSGFADPQRVFIHPRDIDRIISALPTFAPSNEVPDPHWPDVTAGQLNGIVLLAGQDGIGPTPPYMRVHQGVVEAFLAFPDARPEVFYRDDRGLEPLLQDLVLNQPRFGCVTDGACYETTECQCSDEALGVYPAVCDGSAVSPWSLSAIAATLAMLGLAAMRRRRAA